MTIRDSMAEINGDKQTFVCPSDELVVLTSDGREMFSIRMVDGHTIEVRANQHIKDGDDRYNQNICVRPRAWNSVEISREQYT